MIGATVASLGVFAMLKGGALALLFALFVGFSATQMLLDRKPQASRTLPGTAGQLGAGSVIGFLSGLVGAGGGFVSVPFMTWCNVAIHNAVATSAALGFPIALANAIGYVIAGQVWPPPEFHTGHCWRMFWKSRLFTSGTARKIMEDAIRSKENFIRGNGYWSSKT